MKHAALGRMQSKGHLQAKPSFAFAHVNMHKQTLDAGAEPAVMIVAWPLTIPLAYGAREAARMPDATEASSADMRRTSVACPGAGAGPDSCAATRPILLEVRSGAASGLGGLLGQIHLVKSHAYSSQLRCRNIKSLFSFT